MPKWAVLIWVIGTGFAVHAQTNSAATSGSIAPAASPAPATPAVAVPTTSPDNARYLANPALLDHCQKELSAFADKPCNLIFIGGTIVVGWRGPGKAVWDKFYVPRKAFNFSIEGDTTQNVLWRLTNLDLASIHPKVAVIMIGQANAKNTVHEIADGIKAVEVNTQIAFPNIKIIFISIVPNAQEPDKMTQVNSIVRSYADNANVFFVNLVPKMPPVEKTSPDGTVTVNFKGIGPDHFLPDATGYQIWADTMEPVLAPLLR